MIIETNTGGGDDKTFMWLIDDTNIDVPSVPGSRRISCVVEMISGHTDTVTNVGFNFDGSLALTGSYDGSIRVWKVPKISSDLTSALTLHPICVIDGGPEDIEWAQWHSKGNAIIAGSRDGTVWMWMVNVTAGSGEVSSQCLQVFAGKEATRVRGICTCVSHSMHKIRS